ncbi:nitrite reductase large subunit NirB [Adhaeribacter radiodurans]|uniref:Nitrite reductase large subunit n=1 Tax=Adhaeribacter radiodurans TaxID=2745197 RepID=A0A7L7L3I4_9BACT|nr:nitrite reductase large subunit NirB [Adhaeribacter radiodurans]QMU27145.1 nitrite reductase large subunit [Adhaeribacter radiodurans]
MSSLVAQPQRIVVIGNGMVGYKFCEKLVAKAQPSTIQITVFGEEPRPAYDRVHLSAYFSGTSAEELTMAPVEWYAENNINLHLGELVTSIDAATQTVTTHKGESISYDKLILATGSSAFVPPINGVEKEGVFVYRTIEDLDAMLEYAPKARTAAVIGGGLLGLEAAKAAVDMGLTTHVIEFASRLMPRQLDEAGSEMLKRKLESLGISIHLNKSTTAIIGETGVEKMLFADGSELEVDMIIVSAGIKPRDELAIKAGLAVGPRGGILVNDALQTSDANIYAIGESALHGGMIYGLVAPGYDMADTVVTNLLGGEKTFKGFDMSTKLKLIGVDVASFGDAFASPATSRSIVFEDKAKGIYKRINISEDGKYLVGGILVGDAGNYNMLLQTVQNKIILPQDPEDLILGSRGGAAESAGAGVMSLPDEALICSCENVSKGDICSTITDGTCTDVAGIKKCTKAGTGCGGCVPMVNDLLNATLKQMGKEVKKVLCEHFDYSRQELLDIVKVNNIRSYDELLHNHGRGDGCEVCKPAVASIMASTWNELILKQATIQDTNDRYLANIQKGGTYSVVPRIAGGEITPEKLIVIGQVAAKYSLYTKITGGQRIDMFGARIDQLPDIWEELINAGFESGHAYGKSLRTVKSCVGSTWCRYGLHDSVGFAIRVEERYRGLRSPHKLKGGVSGCVRECAEAQSKDFGIIATEKGWNLYICGNGGAKPQHAQLFATDLDTETCIKYLDRFLMFYIKTAEPLNRTATWLNKMEGGMEYLRQVIVEDSLGICDDLDREMEFMVNTYACEWKEVVNNPELRQRFQHFINTPEPDPSIRFKPERGQKVPVI